jgi:endo-beta-N-acetylglucosaminidase D
MKEREVFFPSAIPALIVMMKYYPFKRYFICGETESGSGNNRLYMFRFFGSHRMPFIRMRNIEYL